MTDNDTAIRYARALGWSQASLDSIAMVAESAARHFTDSTQLTYRLTEIADMARAALERIEAYLASEQTLCQHCNGESSAECHVCGLSVCANHCWTLACGPHCPAHRPPSPEDHPND